MLQKSEESHAWNFWYFLIHGLSILYLSYRYNSFHDQLVLTSSSDSRVVLSRAASVSSEPFGYLFDEEDANCQEVKSQNKVSDGVISTYEEHEDSVYAVEWSTVDPWLFASLSYDGRLVINKVPRAEKYRILLWKIVNCDTKAYYINVNM